MPFFSFTAIEARFSSIPIAYLKLPKIRSSRRDMAVYVHDTLGRVIMVVKGQMVGPFGTATCNGLGNPVVRAGPLARGFGDCGAIAAARRLPKRGFCPHSPASQFRNTSHPWTAQSRQAGGAARIAWWLARARACGLCVRVRLRACVMRAPVYPSMCNATRGGHGLDLDALTHEGQQRQ